LLFKPDKERPDEFIRGCGAVSASSVSLLRSKSMSDSYAGNIMTDLASISAYCDLIGATAATIAVSDNTMTLAINEVDKTIDLTGTATMTDLVAAINALTGWTARLLCRSTKIVPDKIADFAATNALGSDNAVTIRRLFDDVSNFPTAYEVYDKHDIVAEEEENIERITKDFFYAKAFDINLNGNGQDQIFFNFLQDCLTASALNISDVSIDSDVWTFNKRSVYLDTSTAIGSLAEYRHLLKTLETTVLFPKGLQNINIVGTKGWSICPSEVRKACKMMIEDRFDTTLYDHWREGSLSIGGDINYQNPRVIHTGIMKVDQILARYIRRRVSFRTTGRERW